jgi:hypothetical protein
LKTMLGMLCRREVPAANNRPSQILHLGWRRNLERAKGLEPSTPTLAR